MSDILKSVLFINIIILDATEGVKQKVKDNIDKMNLPKGMSEAAKKLGSRAASKMATPDVIASKMGQEMPKKMPKEMSEKGMVVEAETVFQEGPYLVVQLQVQKINSVLMAEVKALEAQEHKYDWLIGLLIKFLQFLGVKNQKTLEEQYLPRVVQSKMGSLMDEMLKVKLEEEMKMDAECKVLGEDKQARYFFGKLKEVRAHSKSLFSSSVTKKDK